MLYDYINSLASSSFQHPYIILQYIGLNRNDSNNNNSSITKEGSI